MGTILKNRVLILTAGFGDGHNAAAFHLAKAFEMLGDTEVRVVDIFAVAHPGVDQLLMDAYRFNITHLPGTWHRLYKFSDRISFKNDSLGLFKKVTLRLKEILESWEPAAVVHTYPFYSQLLEKIAGRFSELPFGVFTVITDAGTINATWLKGRTDWFVVSGEESAATLARQGIPEGKVRVLGFPVDPAFAAPLAEALPEDAFAPPARLLYLPSTPRRRVDRTLAALYEAGFSDFTLTIVAGRHARRLRRTMRKWQRRIPGDRLRVVGWTDAIPELLRTHHLVIGKAGGSFVQETLAARRPMLIDHVVPGQEEGNAELLARAGCGERLADPSELPARLESIFADCGKKWQAMVAAAAKRSRPDAAREIARFVLQHSPPSPN